MLELASLETCNFYDSTESRPRGAMQTILKPIGFPHDSFHVVFLERRVSYNVQGTCLVDTCEQTDKDRWPHRKPCDGY